MDPLPRFDRLARVYRWLEYLALGRILERTREQFLPELAGVRHALLLGDGDGRFCQELLRHWPEVQVEAVDGSAAMLAALRRRCADQQVRTTMADLRDFVPDHPVDLVTTHFVLDCLTEPEVKCLIERIAPVLVPGGVWLVSEFRVPPGMLGLPARAYVRLLYFAFRLLTGLRVTRLPDYDRALRGTGLRLLCERHRLGGLLVTQLWRRPISSDRSGVANSVPNEPVQR